MISRLKNGGVAIFASLFLLGTAIAQPRLPPGNPTPCNSGICTLTITVGGDCSKPGNISIDRPFVSVAAPNNMRWVIATPGHAFASDGIRFDPPNAQFEVQHSPRPNEFRIQNKKSQNGDYYYWVNLDGCAPLDPWVRNRN